MSEYQYYEFQAVDKPLNDREIQALEELSTRARITPTSFVNTYNWGDFRGDPRSLVEKYFDAFLYLANWGTHWFMLRIPGKLLDFKTAEQYCPGESAAVSAKGEFLIFEFLSETEDYDDSDGEGQLPSLISLRSDLIKGDRRCLYLAWLLCVQMEELEDNDIEPPVPPNLGNLNAALENFVDFLRIDKNLITVAAKRSENKTTDHQKEFNLWIKRLAQTEKDDYLLRLIRGNEPHLGAELWQRFQQTLPAKKVQNHKPRTVAELLEKAETYSGKRK